MSSRRFTASRVVGLLVVLALLGVAGFFGVRSYRARRRTEAALAAVDAKKPDARLAVRAAEEASLHAGPLPIEEAIRALGMRGRLGLGEKLSPTPSTDVAPLMGWVYQTHDIPEAMTEPPPEEADAAVDGDASVSDAR